jgi:hypothetical protein
MLKVIRVILFWVILLPIIITMGLNLDTPAAILVGIACGTTGGVILNKTVLK